jgi:prephenate dehydrogenase
MSVPVQGPVLIIGSGLLGASLGLSLRRAGVDVFVDDVDADAVAVSVERGAGQPWTGDGKTPSIVVVAVPPEAAGEAMALACAFPGATVTDVTSVKEAPLGEAVRGGGDPSRLVGGHPLAGRESSGAAAARKDLFDDRVWVISPLAESDPAHVARVRDMVTTCRAVPVIMEPGQHDRAVALTSHAPQVLSSLLAAQLIEAEPAAVAVSGQGLRDMTRIAGSNPRLWRSILGANADSVADVLDALSGDLQRVIDSLRRGDDGVVIALERGVEGRALIPGKHGSAAAEYDEVPVIILDEPGELGRLFVAAGELAVNLEDVRIDHVLGKPSGLVELSVRPEATARLVDGLRSRGFDVRA